MALTLPYPDMDFVPLDILTAQEQDQLVANIEYIASQFPIGANNIAENAIIGTKINNGSVTELKLGNGAVTELKLGNGAVTADKIGGGAVTNAKIANSAVTNAKIANSAVKSQNIDWTTIVKLHDSYTTSTTGSFSRNINISTIPNGAIFGVIANGFVNLNAGGNACVVVSYNGVNSTNMWVDNSTGNRGAFPICVCMTFTKVSGQNTLTLKSTTANGVNDKGFDTIVL